MKKLKAVFFITLISITIFSCDWIFKPGHCDASGPVIVYRTTKDYSDKVTVQLSKDGEKVTAYPGKMDVISQKPIKLAGGYLLKRMVGDAVLSLTIDDYAVSTKNYSNTELFNLIIDKNPYLEKYECCECTGIDTAAINDLIRKNQISKCKELK